MSTRLSRPSVRQCGARAWFVATVALVAGLGAGAPAGAAVTYPSSTATRGLSSSGVVKPSATPGAAAAGGCAGTAYVTNEDGTVSVITTATGAVSAPVTVSKAPVGVAICPARSAHRRR